MTIKRLLTLPLLLAALLPRTAAAADGFAIVIDAKSLAEAGQEVKAYAKAIEDVNGMRVYTVTDRWGIPDSIRATLRAMHGRGQIRGAVFIGDIPVPMIRDAQHLTSAFKMDQRMPKEQSSVPSDRYYDDFGLDFKFLERDSTGTLFYYSLTSTGRQHIRCDLFTGRIRPTDAGGTSRYEKLRAFLRKAAAEKRENNRLDQVMFFTGQGSLSESRVAAMDEKAQYYEHFPWMRQTPASGITYIDYAQEKYIKPTLMDALQREDLDVGVLHHHGDYDTQYLGRQNKDVADSIDERLRDLHLPDFAEWGFRPNCRVVIFDACYNAAFQNPDCIANEYIFSGGKTVACMGGTVNLIQDKWYDRALGLLAFGHTVGEVNCLQELLESHIVGDPTFFFAPERGMKEASTADGTALRLALGYEKGRIKSGKLLEALGTSPHDQVRMQALQLLARENNADFVKGLAVAANDRFEMVQRFAVNYIRANGSPELALPLMRLLADPATSARVRTDAEMAVELMPADALQRAFKEVWAKANYVDKDSLGAKLQNKIGRFAGYWNKEIDEMIADTLREKAFRFTASCMRLYCPHSRVADILAYIADKSHAEARRLQLIEAMGWYNYSCKAAAISRAAKALSEDSSESEAIRAEALKTWKRINWK